MLLSGLHINANYNFGFSSSTIEISDVFGIEPSDPDLYFAFESQHTPYQKLGDIVPDIMIKDWSIPHQSGL